MSHDYPLNICPLDAADGGGFLIEVPDLPGCVADGATIEEALHEIKSAIESWIKTAKEFGDPIPTPSTAMNYSGQWRIRVPKHLHAALALQAKKEGVSLNMFAATLLAEGIGKKISATKIKNIKLDKRIDDEQ